jgi:dihydrofolate synthase/folylpolyglutamate synthase
MTLEAWLDLLEQRHPLAIELGLERCGAVYRQLGSPRPAKQVFTVGGTNGKGSTVAYLAAMSGSQGQRYGTYTSPHIFRFNERISIMGEPVSDDRLVCAFEQVEAARGEVSLTYFEFSTLAALLILHQAQLDCAILEVGLGGRLDTVNLVDADCVVITPIGLDHQEFLGPDLDSIATEKAGIIRTGVPLVCTENNPPAPVLRVAQELHAPVYRRGLDFDLVVQPATDIDRLQFLQDGQVMSVARPSMAGVYQLDNLAAALCAFVLLNPDCFSSASEISTAIRNTRVPGRLQRVCTSPPILLDVGHNIMAAEAVAAFLEQDTQMHTTCVLAMLADKPAGAVASALGKVCKRWLCAPLAGSRGQTGESLANRVRAVLPDADVSAFESLDAAMEEAVSSAGEDGRILVFGSFLTVSGAAIWVQNSLQREGHDA